MECINNDEGGDCAYLALALMSYPLHDRAYYGMYYPNNNEGGDHAFLTLALMSYLLHDSYRAHYRMYYPLIMMGEVTVHTRHIDRDSQTGTKQST